MFYFQNCNNKIRIFSTVLVLGYACTVHAAADKAPTDVQERIVVNDKSTITEEFNQTFNKMLDNPADVDLTMHYANLAVQLENYEAAVPALERILLFNPDLPRVKQQLGVLYFKLNSFEMAKSYLEGAKKGDNVPADVVASADEYLAKIK
ncbi:MAG: hypothetical protein K0R98_1977 [Rickettsiaceae bacterium]|jgi:tetratricopeptide (TPR) repeat protein|nr:hypothetical protein [Rickettsiaceae bacterium]